MKDMTVGSEAKHILIFSLPMLIGNVFQQMYNMTDSIIVGRFVGKEALASVGACFPVIFFMIAIIMGLSMGFTVVIGNFFGAKKIEEVKTTIDTTLISLFVISIPVTILGLIFSKNILLLLKTPDEIIVEAKKYIDVIFYGTVFSVGYNTIGAILRGLGDSLTPLFFLIFSSILNVVLDILFVTYFKMGVSGVAWATIISQGVSFILGLIYMELSNHEVLRLRFVKMKFDFAIFLKSIRIGFPTAVQQILVSLGMIALSRIVNSFGTTTIAAYTAAGRLDSFALMPAMNFSMAISTFVAQNLGANKLDRVKRGVKSTIAFSSAIAITISIAFVVFSKELITVFNKDSEVVSVGMQYLHIVSPFYLVFSLMFVFNGILRGAGDTLIPMFITLLSLWIVRIPISAFLSMKIGTAGIWWGIPIAWLIGTGLDYLYYLSGRWKRNVLTKGSRYVSDEILG
ncbi:MAG TPA: MATE family efflux transporter [Spirochaetota bacterium]|nr:MAG: Multidrug export protein MepA [Spirochaetes bacterium ADurb.Bin133]HNZ26908.1 MATE family efflux transporter [Spirochaetota bacterium]HOF00248.1 MATE family efflux transporter [Spirochaetota bacterium]HOS32236.1 MATE family efflux transporter [Spirochaetota bacterium]HOS55104.1 MATE family efflux transporter [Spirochaetota bacterium]